MSTGTHSSYRMLLSFYRPGIFWTLILAASLTIGKSFDAAGQQNTIKNERRSGSTGVPVKPIYNPHTKSYFELRVDLPKPPNWSTAVKYVRRNIYKGVRGRLAIVRDIETHSFLQANFEVMEEAWIGLRYFCSFRKLVWADGSEQPRSKFKLWHRNWSRTNVKCGSARIPYMPVYYLPTKKGFKWQASGPAKSFVSYFVEYPTGSENPQAKKKSVPSAKADPADKK